jgi:hypothetical protein
MNRSHDDTANEKEVMADCPKEQYLIEETVED